MGSLSQSTGNWSEHGKSQPTFRRGGFQTRPYAHSIGFRCDDGISRVVRRPPGFALEAGEAGLWLCHAIAYLGFREDVAWVAGVFAELAAQVADHGPQDF